MGNSESRPAAVADEALDGAVVVEPPKAIIVRQASTEDLDAIHELIRQSFSAMKAHTYLWHSFWDSSAEKMIQGELSKENFHATYFANVSEPDNCFWVAEKVAEKTVIGCVGLKRKGKSATEVELVRMSVNATARGQGVGSMLVHELCTHVKERLSGVEKIVLTTANPDSAKFYAHVGFNMYSRWLFTYGERPVSAQST